MPDQPGIVPHREFLERVSDARFDSFRSDPKTRVRDEAAFRAMQEHIRRLYDAVEVVHSFTDEAGHVFDCVPFDQQPSVRANPAAGPKQAPDIPELARSPREARPQEPQQLQGNAPGCPPGTIAMRRITLEQLTRCSTLDDFLKKAPPALRATQRPEPRPPDVDSAQNHRYAYVEQNVESAGAHAFLNLWSPRVDAPDQIFSLAQHWYTGGTGAAHQSLEIGWQVYPEKYGHAQPVLFVFWTPDNYVNGNYNLDAPAFVQTNSTWAIGGVLTPVSVAGGAQMEIEVTAYLHEEKWWLYVGGTRSSDALGYYPVSIFNGGRLATGATQVVLGGETACRAREFGPMGSGAYGDAGWPAAAYQRDIYYFAGDREARWAALSAHQPSPGCYTVDLSSAPDPWNVYFFFGGPGSPEC